MEFIDRSRMCDESLRAGKNLKCLLRQNLGGKLPKTKEVNEKVALNFAGPFQKSKQGKNFLLVSIDHFSAWPDAKMLHQPTTSKVIDFLEQYITNDGVPKP